jgi:4-aminobutyrate aminotransferase-like enzyme
VQRTLPVLAAMHPDAVEEAFRAACGMSGALTEPKVPVSETLAKRRARVGPNLSLAYTDPLKVTRGWMQYLFDEDGAQYLDAYNNVPHVGHSHPRIVQAVADQMRALNTNTRYLHDTIWQYAERLCATLPDPLRVCFFVNSGSEANELALRLARAHTGARDLIVLDAAYHGNTTTLIEISPYKFNGPGGTGAPEWVHVAPIPADYRGAFKRADRDAGHKYGEQVAEIVERLRRGGHALAGFICETCPSVGGQIIPPPGYLESTYRHVRAAGGICIADEVQTAYGRMGSTFYAFEAQGVVPDIVVLGKPIGNGYPLGAVVTTREIAASFDNGMEFFSTFGGSTVSSAAGLAVLETVVEEELQAHADRVGSRLLAGLRELAGRYPLIGDVRGSGLFIGVELVRDPETLTPATEAASKVVNRMRQRRVLLGTDGPFHNVLKIRPPMPFHEGDVDRLVTTLDEALGGIEPR